MTGSFQIQRQQPSQNRFLVAQYLMRPPIRIAHGLVERAVQVVQAGREIGGVGGHLDFLHPASDIERVIQIGQRAVFDLTPRPYMERGVRRRFKSLSTGGEGFRVR